MISHLWFMTLLVNLKSYCNLWPYKLFKIIILLLMITHILYKPFLKIAPWFFQWYWPFSWFIIMIKWFAYHASSIGYCIIAFISSIALLIYLVHSNVPTRTLCHMVKNIWFDDSPYILSRWIRRFTWLISPHASGTSHLSLFAWLCWIMLLPWDYFLLCCWRLVRNMSISLV